MSPKRLALDLDNVIQSYTAGESENAIAERMGVGRNVIRRRLLQSGIALRSRSEAMCLRAETMSADERKSMALAANTARRGQVEPRERVHARAIQRQTKSWQIGEGEQRLLDWLNSRGITGTAQMAIDGYNIDIAIPPIAVELITSGRNPMERPNVRHRIKRLTDSGWHVLYIWVLTADSLCESVVDDVIAFLQEAQSDPSPIGQYRVVWGASKTVAAGRGDLD